MIKERARCYKADMPVKELPSIIIKRMVLNAVLFLNAYVDKQGISEEYSPRELILRWQLPGKYTASTTSVPTEKHTMIRIPP